MRIRFLPSLLCLAMMPVALFGQAAPDSAPDEPQRPVRAPLLAEGAIITNAEGVMVRDERSPLWRFRLSGASADPQGRQREFVLLPCRLLEEMEDKAESIAPAQAHFSVTGEVLSYGRENWLLPQHVEWITQHTQRNEPDTLPTDPSEPEPATEETARDPAVDDTEARDQGDSIADIVADLQASVGPLRRSVDAGGDQETELLAGPVEGRRLVSRRGRLGRGRTGAWMFVLDSDVNGLNDPSLVLLPSQRLSRLEAYGGYGWMGQPMLISGEVFTYRGRHFLRPTAWKISRERPNLIR